MAFLQRLALAALCAGILAGILAAAAHQFATVPLILKAEAYEDAAAGAAPAPAPRSAEHHDPAAESWAPQEGFERFAYTLAGDVMAGIGFALLLVAGIALRGDEVTWREGLFWGLGGFLAFTVAPGLGLAPDIPGNDAGPLLQRQLWWMGTAGLTGIALALLAFARHPLYAAAAGLLILLPHLFGAPELPSGGAAAAPAWLAREFAVAATLTSFLFWAALGAMTGQFYKLFGRLLG